MGSVPQKKKRRVAVFIDGSNLYFKIKTLVPTKMDLLHYRYRDLVKSMVESDEQLTYIGYYVGVVRDAGKYKGSDKLNELVKRQQQLFEELKKQRITLVRGYLLEHAGRFFEKGVDVRLALDIAGMAHAKEYDVALIISSDTDLIPAMLQAQHAKREVVHVGFEHQPSLALIRHANRSRLLTRKEVEKFSAKPITIRRFDEQ